MKYITIFDIYGVPITIFHRSENTLSTKFGFLLSLITLFLLTFHTLIELPPVFSKSQVPSMSLFKQNSLTYKPNLEIEKQNLPFYVFMNNDANQVSVAKYLKSELSITIFNETDQEVNKIPLKPCNDSDILYLQSLDNKTAIRSNPLCITEFDKNLTANFKEYYMRITFDIDICTALDDCFDKGFNDDFRNGKISVSFGLVFYDSKVNIRNSEQLIEAKAMTFLGNNKNTKSVFDVSLNYLDVVRKNPGFLSHSTESETKLSVISYESMKSLMVFHLNLSDNINPNENVSIYMIEHLRLSPALANIIAPMIIYILFFSYLSKLYCQYSINTEIINKNFEWYRKEDELIEKRRMTTVTESNPFSTEREVKALNPTKDFEEVRDKYKVMKGERKRLKYGCTSSLLLCCKSLFGKSKNRHDTLYQKCMKLVSRDLSIENLMKLSIRFNQLKEYVLSNAERVLFDRRGKLIVYNELVPDSALGDDFVESYDRDTLQEFYNMMYTNNLHNERMFKHLQNDLKYIYKTNK
jgi:hypothetical protein